MDSNATLREIKNENSTVFRRLFEDLYTELVKHANNYIFDKSSSEDVVQEVFVYLWENAEKIELKSSLKAYLYAMVRNKCLNILKSVKITDAAKIVELQATFDTQYFPDYMVNEEEDLLQHKAIDTLTELPAKMQTIVRLRFMDNYKYAEIADELGVSVNTIKTQLKRAKRPSEDRKVYHFNGCRIYDVVIASFCLPLSSLFRIF